MNKLATQHQIECMELAALNAKTERRVMRQRMERAEAAAEAAERRRLAEREKHREEMNGVTCGVAAIGLAAVAIGCFATAPWWTAVAPAIFAMIFVRKAGW